MSHLTARPAATLFKLTLLSLPLLLAACSNSGSVPAGPDAADVAPLGVSSTSVQVDARPGTSAGTNGSFVTLLSNGSTATLTVPAGVSGSVRLQLQAKADLYQGAPIVEIRKSGTVLSKVTVTSATAGLYDAGTVTVQPGDVLSVVFVNDAGGRWPNDRNALIDYALFTAADTTTTTTAPTPTPTSTPTPAPTPPTTTVPAGAVDVKTLGVKGDGVTDDSAALGRVASLAAGRSIYFPPGTYLVSRAVLWSGLRNVTIQGSGATLKAAANWAGGVGSALGILSLDGANNVTVSGLKVAGFANRNLSSWSNRMDGVYVNRSAAVTVSGVTVTNTQGNGVNGENSSDFRVTGSTTQGVHGHGIVCAYCQRTAISGNSVDGGADPNATSSNPNAGLGIFVRMGDTALIENNVILNHWDTATKTEGTSNVTYRGNTVNVFGKDGIKIQSHPGEGVTQVRGGVIENNTVRGFKAWRWDGSGGILLQGVAGGRVAGNRMYGDGLLSREDTGIKLDFYGSRSRDIVVEDNEVQNANVGLLIETENATAVRRNRFTSTGRAMKHCINIGGGSGSLIEDNTFTGFGAICTLAYGGSNTTIQRNSYGDGDTGVYLDGNAQTGFRILSNTFASTVSSPLNVSGTLTCSGNTGNVPTRCR